MRKWSFVSAEDRLPFCTVRDVSALNVVSAIALKDDDSW